MTKKMTIDDLAIMVKKGFDDVDDQFKEVHHQFTGVHGQFKELRAQMDAMEERLTTKIDAGLFSHQNQIDTLRDNMRLVKTKIGLK